MTLRPAIQVHSTGRRLIPAMLAVILAGCEVYATAPPCPFRTEPIRAPSAGCFAVENGELLVVQDRQGRISPPGGSTHPGESAQCAAYRETWEETGLSMEPTALLGVFDTGFHLYRCHRTVDSGDIGSTARHEVKAAFFLSPAEFDDWEWRFAGQQRIMRDLMERVLSTTPQDPGTSGQRPTRPERG